MKNILFALIGLVCSFGCLSQSITNKSANIQYPRNITPYAIINVKTGDTVSWFWNEAEIKSYVTGNPSGWATTANVTSSIIAVLPMTIYTYSITPLYHISAPVYSLCVTKDTGLYIKVLGIDSANWYKVR